MFFESAEIATIVTVGAALLPFIRYYLDSLCRGIIDQLPGGFGSGLPVRGFGSGLPALGFGSGLPACGFGSGLPPLGFPCWLGSGIGRLPCGCGGAIRVDIGRARTEMRAARGGKRGACPGAPCGTGGAGRARCWGGTRTEMGRRREKRGWRGGTAGGGCGASGLLKPSG